MKEFRFGGSKDLRRNVGGLGWDKEGKSAGDRITKQDRSRIDSLPETR